MRSSLGDVSESSRVETEVMRTENLETEVAEDQEVGFRGLFRECRKQRIKFYRRCSVYIDCTGGSRAL